MKQDAAEFQAKIEAEFDKQKAQFDEAFKAYSERFDAEPSFDAAFTSSVSEHLNIARDEGARITADAMAEAEKLDRETGTGSQSTASYDLIRDAVNDISRKDSQSAILKSLVKYAGDFAPRGAFFIIKNDHFVGWKTFGDDGDADQQAIREIHFSTAADSLLGASTRSLGTVSAATGDHSEDSAFMTPLQFGQPDKMYSIPLVARGRGVAVLYADHGNNGEGVNLEALETLVRVAGLTVELLAAHSAKTENRAAAADFEDAGHETDDGTRPEPEMSYGGAVSEIPAAADNGSTGFAFSDSVSFQGGLPQETETEASYEAVPVVEDEYVAVEPDVMEEAPTTVEAQPEPVMAEPERVVDYDFAPSVEPAELSYTDEPALTEEHPNFDSTVETADFASDNSVAPDVHSASPFEAVSQQYEPAAAVNGGGYGQMVDPVVEAVESSSSKPRLSERNVDLPIEVSEDERGSHVEARRFARLL